MYYSYKNYYPIVLQGLADPRYRFIVIDVGAYGNNQTCSGVFGRSERPKVDFRKINGGGTQSYLQRGTMPEQKATLTEPLRATPSPYG